jgi:hypothetical protein
MKKRLKVMMLNSKYLSGSSAILQYTAMQRFKVRVNHGLGSTYSIWFSFMFMICGPVMKPVCAVPVMCLDWEVSVGLLLSGSVVSWQAMGALLCWWCEFPETQSFVPRTFHNKPLYCCWREREMLHCMNKRLVGSQSNISVPSFSCAVYQQAFKQHLAGSTIQM